MKEIRTIKLVEQTTVVFEAEDGKQFDNELECLTHERRANEEKVKANFEKLAYSKINIPILEYFNSEASVYKIKLFSKCDYLAMIDYMHIVLNCSDNYTKEPTEYPCEKIVVTGYEWFDYYNADLAVELADAVKALF